jgi:bifunctional DNA-binding transcriptional regulator/antitoxin component of YhaV-PrlF toxin-antitoxin module
MIKAHTRAWGNSIGVVIPREVVRELNIKPHEELVIDIQRKSGTVLKELFGALKWKKPPREVLREARRGMESRF